MGAGYGGGGYGNGPYGFPFNREPIKVLAQVIQGELQLPDGRVALADQRLVVPTGGLFIELAYTSIKPIGNNNYVRPMGDGMQEVQQQAMQWLVQVDVMSFDDQARLSLPAVLGALVSVRAQQAMGAERIQIGRIPPTGFLNVSALEASAMLNRYTMTLPLKSLQQKVQTVEYYDKFKDPEVHVNA